MLKNIPQIATAGLVAAVLTATGLRHEPAKAQSFAQLSSATSQQPKDARPFVIQMESKDAIANLEATDAKPGDVVIKTAGVYFVMAAAQVGRDSGQGEGWVDLWLRQNGKDVANSNTRQSIGDAKFTAVLVSQGLVECKAGDVINVMAAVNAPGSGLGIIATRPPNEPVIPSIIFSIYAVN